MLNSELPVTMQENRRFLSNWERSNVSVFERCMHTLAETNPAEYVHRYLEVVKLNASMDGRKPNKVKLTIEGDLDKLRTLSQARTFQSGDISDAEEISPISIDVNNDSVQAEEKTPFHEVNFDHLL